MKQLSLLDMKLSKKVPSPSKARTPPLVSPVEKVLAQTDAPSPQAPVKAPDPKSSSAKHLFSYQALLSQPYDLKTFARIARIAANSKFHGTEQFASVVAEFDYQFEEPAERFNWPMSLDKKTSWAEGAERLFEYCERDLGKFEIYLNDAWDRKKMDDECDAKDQHNNWNLRKFTHAIACQDPTVLFHIDEERPDLDPQFQNTFWDYTGWFNPKFKVDAHPLSQMWILCSYSFGHPWAVKDSTPASLVFNERKQRQRLVRANKKQRARKRAQVQNSSSDGGLESENLRPQAPVPPRTPDKYGVRFRVDGEVLESGMPTGHQYLDDHDVVMRDVHEVAIHPALSPTKISKTNKSRETDDGTSEGSIKCANSRVKGPPAATVFTPIATAVPQDDPVGGDDDEPPPLVPREFLLDDYDDDSDDEDYLPPLKDPAQDHVLGIAEPIDEDEIPDLLRGDQTDSDDDSEEETDVGRNQPRRVGVGRDPSSPAGPPAMRRSHRRVPLHNEDPTVARIINERSEVMAVDSPQGSQRSFRDVAAAPPPPPPPGRLLSDDERIAALIQPNLEGLPIQNMRLLTVNIPFTHNGGNGKNSIAQACLKEVQEFLNTLFQNRDQRFRLLPLADTKYRTQKLWIDSREKVSQKLGQWHSLKPYIDLANGNAEWITSLGKQAGQKVLRTRMRFAFDDTEEGAIATISSILEENGGGCFRSPLQVGDMVRIGFLPFYPPGMSRSIMEKEIMRHLEFETAIGLGLDWVSLPTTQRNTWKAGQNSPGVRLWHVFVDGKVARAVDSQLRQWLHPNTPKRDFPYAAITQYCHDWKAVNRNRLSVNPYGPVRDLIFTMATKAVDFTSVTETFCSPIPIPGMLKVVETEKFGKTSLLRFLLSIKATPAQADSANSGPSDREEKDETGTDDANGNGGDDAASKLQQATEEAMFAGRPGALEAARRAEMVRKKDLENTDASGLFQIITPESMPQFYLFTSRLRSIQLATNVVDGMCAFIIAHLEESDRSREAYILRSWLGAAEYSRVRNRNIVWSGEEMRAVVVSTDGNGAGRVDQGLDWLDFGRDVTDQAQGFLEVDMDLADTRDIDDGATVAAALDELRRAEDRIEEMIQEITIRQDENALLRARVAELEAQQANPSQQRTEATARALTSRPGPSQNRTQADRGGGSSTARP